MDLLDKLDSLGQEINQFCPEINSGGCCVFAAAVAMCLEEVGISARGIVASWAATNHTTPISKIRQKIKENSAIEWRDNGIYFSHVGVEFNYKSHLYHYDTTGVRPKSDNLANMPIYRGRLKPGEMKSLADSPIGWNETFPRWKIFQIRRIIKKRLKM